MSEHEMIVKKHDEMQAKADNYVEKLNESLSQLVQDIEKQTWKLSGVDAKEVYWFCKRYIEDYDRYTREFRSCADAAYMLDLIIGFDTSNNESEV